MNTFEIKNIVAKRDENLLISAISFTVTATNAEGESADAGWNYKYPTSVPASQEYSEAEVTALCNTIALEKGIYLELSNTLIRRKSTDLHFSDANAPVVGNLPVLSPEELIKAMMNHIDTTIAAIYMRYQRFQLEYIEREAAARKYKEAGYTGEPTVWISHFATNAGLGLKEATDLIIEQADNYRSAIVTLGQLRMDKYKVLHALTPAEARLEYDKTIAACDFVDASLK
jgi:hypothetical protein